MYYEGKVYRHIKVSSGGTPGVKGQVPTNTEYWKEITISDLFKELSNAASILSTLTLNDFDYSGGPTQIGAPPYTVNESLKAIANVLRSLNSNFIWKDFAVGLSAIKVSFSNTWNELCIIVGNSSNKFVFNVPKQLVIDNRSNGLTQGYGTNTSNYCVINVSETEVSIVGFVLGGNSTPCDIFVSCDKYITSFLRCQEGARRSGL